MRELSMHILDIAQNSIAAGATLVTIDVLEDTDSDTMVIRVEDNGRGMDPEFAMRIRDPFVTTRTTRDVGLGVPLFAAAAERCGGGLTVETERGRGTVVAATFRLSHIDRAPLGDMAGTVVALAVCNPGVDFVYNHSRGGKSLRVDTREIRTEVGDIPLSHPEVASFIRQHIAEGEKELGA
ncbi:MAG: ATP-binding protein [Firmicutes bacterium]|jgi:hypothetical protein|nr:ATP-binding protein [Bacillota bacterium]